VQGLPASSEGKCGDGRDRAMIDPVNLRKRSRIRTLKPWEMGAAANLWAAKYPEPLTEDQSARALPIPAKIGVVLKNDYVRTVLAALLVAFAFFLLQLPIVLSRIPDAETAFLIGPHLKMAKDEQLRADAREEARIRDQREFASRLASIEVGFGEYRKATDENFRRLFQMMENRQVARNGQ
jgi:hypothetical protein